MPSSIVDLVQSRSSALERYFSLLSLLGQFGPQQTAGPGGSVVTQPGQAPPTTIPQDEGVLRPYAQEPTFATQSLATSPNPGQTAYPYATYAKPYAGVPGGMVTRHGFTLQRGPYRSLRDIALESDFLPKARELNEINQGYRSYGAQQSAYARKPGLAARPGYSYHGQGLAIDVGNIWQQGALRDALTAAGWNQFNRGLEPWHYSYGVTG